jgi:uncharacterized protein
MAMIRPGSPLARVAFAAAILALVCEAAALGQAALQVPLLRGRVNDYGEMMSAVTEEAIGSKLQALEASDSTQVVVLTVPSLRGEDLEGFSIKVAEAWKIGTKGQDNGVILLVSRDDHKVRIEVGLGLEGRLTDLLSGRIVDRIIVPAFKEGRYDEGFAQGVDAIIAAVKGEYKGNAQPPAAAPSGWTLPLLVVFALVAALVGSRYRVGGGIAGAALLPLFGWLAWSLSPWALLGLLPLGFAGGLILPSVLAFGGGRTHGGRGPWTGGGWSGGGSSSGGGGGFSGGGGGFGGGGASGRW